MISYILDNSSAVYTTALVSFCGLPLAYIIYQLFLDPLRDVPGPFWARFSRLWLYKKLLKGNLQHTQMQVHASYGPVVRLAPNHYSFNDLETVKTVYAHGAKFLKSNFYAAFNPPPLTHSSLFSEQDEKNHATARRKNASMYSLTSLLSYEDFVSQNNDLLLFKFSQMAREGKSINVVDWMQYYAFDVIGSITVGQPFGFLNHGFDFQGIRKEIHNVMIYGARVGTLCSKLHYLIFKFGHLLGYKIPKAATQKYILENIKHKRELIADGETTQATTGKQDFVEKMLGMLEKGKIEEVDLQLTVANNIHAGSDTTAIALTAILYYLIQTPDMMQELRDEIKRHKDAGTISTPIHFREAQELSYLQAVIKEGLRMHPPLGVSLPRVVPEGGVTLCDRYFPAGTVVGVNAWVINHNKEAFGPDADRFNPERWLESKERTSEMDRYFFTFGAGGRVCLGKNIAALEMSTVIPELVSRFDFMLEKPGKEWELNNNFFVFQNYQVLLKERQIE